MANQLKNFGFNHKSGILLPVSALPSKYGIGSFGKCAFDFVDFLSATGTKCWQVLPLNPTSYGDSPYQSPASVAGNPIYSWKTMQNDRYGWWKNRVGQCFKLYDILRIDHFRGFAGYYVIPAGDTTAKNGGFCGVNVYNCENRQKLLTIAISCDIIIKH